MVGTNPQAMVCAIIDRALGAVERHMTLLVDDYGRLGFVKAVEAASKVIDRVKSLVVSEVADCVDAFENLMRTAVLLKYSIEFKDNPVEFLRHIEMAYGDARKAGVDGEVEELYREVNELRDLITAVGVPDELAEKARHASERLKGAVDKVLDIATVVLEDVHNAVVEIRMRYY